jgi:hypothetical protein
MLIKIQIIPPMQQQKVTMNDLKIIFFSATLSMMIATAWSLVLFCWLNETTTAFAQDQLL